MKRLQHILITFAAIMSTAPMAQPADAEPVAVQIAEADIPGNWMGVHPEWKQNIFFYPDGTLVRPHNGGGLWKLKTEDGKPSVELRWNSWGIETLTAVSPDHLRLTKPRGGVFHLYRIPTAPPRGIPLSRDKTEIDATKARLDDSKWQLIDRKRFALNADGSISSEFDDRKGSWEVVAPNTLKISVPWQPKPPEVITTNRDATLLRWTDDETNLAVREGA